MILLIIMIIIIIIIIIKVGAPAIAMTELADAIVLEDCNGIIHFSITLIIFMYYHQISIITVIILM